MSQFGKTIDDPQNLSQGEAHDQFYGIMTQLMDEYNKEENFDKLKSVEHKLQIAERKIKNSIVQAMENNAQMQETDEKARRLKEDAEEFEDGSEQLKNSMSIRNTKVKLILGVIVVAVVIAVVLMIFK